MYFKALGHFQREKQLSSFKLFPISTSQSITLFRKVANGLEPGLKGKQAADMMELTWDLELAKGAQMWANQCLFEHDGRRTCKFNWIGQNMYRAFFREKPSVRTERWKGYVEGWYAEVIAMNLKYIAFQFKQEPIFFSISIFAFIF